MNITKKLDKTLYLAAKSYTYWKYFLEIDIKIIKTCCKISF